MISREDAPNASTGEAIMWLFGAALAAVGILLFLAWIYLNSSLVASSLAFVVFGILLMAGAVKSAQSEEEGGKQSI